jgi:Homeodomain-like domain
MQNDVQAALARWDLAPCQVRERMYQAPTARERERWHALWLLAQGWSAAAVARAFERDPHTIGAWLDAVGQHGPAALAFAHTGGSPPPSTRPARLS